MRRYTLAIALLLAAVAVDSAIAAEPLRIGAISRSRRDMLELPLPAAAEPAKVDMLFVSPLANKPLDLTPYRVIVFLPEVANRYAEIDAHAEKFRAFVERGGGIVVFQPNPMKVYPPDARRPKSLPTDLPAAEFATPKFLPLAATFYNRYVQGEKMRVGVKDHPITRGFKDEDMPFPADRMFDLDRAYNVLAAGTQSESPSLAVATFGKGRIVLCGDNVGGGSYSHPSPLLVARMIRWASGANDEYVEGVREVRYRPATEGERWEDLGSFWPEPERMQDWFWPDDKAAEAAREGLIALSVEKAPVRAAVFERLAAEIRLTIKGSDELTLPGDWLQRIAFEVAPENEPAKVLSLRRMLQITGYPTDAFKPGGWTRNVDVGFLTEPLIGLPHDDPYLPVGRYKWRLVLFGQPPVRSEWQALEVVVPPLSEQAQAVAKRRPNGKLILVAPNRPCRRPDGTPAKPFADLGEAVSAARPGDTVFCEPGLISSKPFTLPDDVWIIGSGAADTLVTMIPVNSQPLILTSGSGRLEGLTIRCDPADSGAGSAALFECRGKAAQPTLFQCALFAEKGYGVTAWDGAAPALQNCVIVSAVGGYGVFARNGARPAIDHCTIVSRGFGVGMMDQSVPTIRKCIVAGQCPVIISDDGEFGLSASVIFGATPGGLAFTHPIMRFGDPAKPDGPSYEPMTDVLKRKDIVGLDPQFVLSGGLLEFFSVAPGSDAAAYGAFAGKDGKWPAAAAVSTERHMPKLDAWLRPQADQPAPDKK